MGIICDDRQQVFHLQGKDISYIFTILKNYQLGHIYFGKKIRHNEHLWSVIRTTRRPYSDCVFEGDYEFSLDYLPTELTNSFFRHRKNLSIP